MSSLLRLHRYRPAVAQHFLAAAALPQRHPSHNQQPLLGHAHNPAGAHHRHFSFDSAFNAISNSAAVAHLQHGLVQLHDVTGLPWWATIITATVLARACITLPLTIYQHRITARLELISAEFPAIVKELKQETVRAKHQLGISEAQALRLYNRSLKLQWDKLVVRDNCHPAKTFCVIWGQVPLWIMQSMALRNLLSMQPDPASVPAQLVLAELALGGCAWFPNLAEVDGALVLPVLLGALNLAIIEIQIMSRRKERGRLQTYATNFFRLFSVAMVPIAAGVPSALCLYWTASSAFGLGQNLLLLAPRVRRAVGIPLTASEIADPYAHLRRTAAVRWAAMQAKVASCGGGKVAEKS